MTDEDFVENPALEPLEDAVVSDLLIQDADVMKNAQPEIEPDDLEDNPDPGDPPGVSEVPTSWSVSPDEVAS